MSADDWMVRGWWELGHKYDGGIYAHTSYDRDCWLCVEKKRPATDEAKE